MKLKFLINSLCLLVILNIYGFGKPFKNDQIQNVVLTKDTHFTGRGNGNVLIARLKFNLKGSSSDTCQSIDLNMNGTSNISDVESVKIYSSGSVNKFDPRNPKGSTLLGEISPQSKNIVCETQGTFSPGVNYLWLTYHTSEKATEGDTVNGSFLSLETSIGAYKITQPQPTGGRIILLARKLIYAPGDLGSANYRLPAIITAPDGSIVLANNKDKYDQGDLPDNDDIMITRSTDGGKTWLTPITIARAQGKMKGFSDPSLTLAPNGDIICVFAGGQGLFESTPTDLIRTYLCRSSDDGKTWTHPKDITNQLYGNGTSNPVRKKWYASFCASGRGLLTRSGRILLAAAVRETKVRRQLSNYVYYSDDNGYTWKVSQRVMLGGNEAKMVELNNGNILMSIRNENGGPRYYNISTDGGVKWGKPSSWPNLIEPGCNGSIIRYTSTVDGYNKNRLLLSIPNATSRKNVTVFLSYDEGKTWPVKKSICPGSSMYSSLTILPNGTIGAYVEVNNPASLYFINFSLNWLTNGKDHYSKPSKK